MTTPSGPDVPTLRGEMTALSLFGGRLALSALILFSLFLTDILMLGLISVVPVCGAISQFVLCTLLCDSAGPFTGRPAPRRPSL